MVGQGTDIPRQAEVRCQCANAHRESIRAEDPLSSGLPLAMLNVCGTSDPSRLLRAHRGGLPAVPPSSSTRQPSIRRVRLRDAHAVACAERYRLHRRPGLIAIFAECA